MQSRRLLLDLLLINLVGRCCFDEVNYLRQKVIRAALILLAVFLLRSNVLSTRVDILYVYG
jgi:hypothetical protein